MSSPLRIFVIGGHGRVALQFTRLAAQAGHTVVSQIRNADHANDLPSVQGTGKVEPLVESLEDLSVESLSSLLQKHKPNVVLFSAGAGGKGGAERTFKVDRDGAIKVFDAIEKANLAKDQSFRRFILVSAVDVRNVEHTNPDWYTDDDFAKSKKMRDVLGTYMQAKYEADANLANRVNVFPWTVLRPTSLLDDPATGVSLAERKGIAQGISRESVGQVLLALAELPRNTTGANNQMWDLTQGKGDVHAQVSEAVKCARTDWLG